MGLIRSYSRTHGDLDWAGDPGFGKWFKKATRIPKGIRKFQPGKFVAKALPAALSFLPGGSIIGAIASRFGVSPGVAQQIASLAGYGDIVGGYEGDPAPKKRKAAASGTKAKAKAKAEKKAKPKKAKPSKAKKAEKKGADGIDWGKIGEAATSLLPVGADLAKEIARQARGGTLPSDELDLGAIAGGGAGMKLPRGMFGGRRRSMNPANVKALRRGIRRLEGFERLVKSVERAYPRMRRASRPATGGRRARGHRSGCGCAVCKR